MKKFISLLISSIFILGILFSGNVLAQISVGVKEGDWIEYNVSYTGSPPESYPEWVRIEITNVQGMSITADLITERLDGSSDTNSGTFNLETGAPELLLIPAGLDVGDNFYHEDFGDVEILWIEDYTYAGAKRTVVAAPVSELNIHWDRSTGILVQADQAGEDFTQNWLVDKTNMWQSQIFGLDSIIFYLLIIAVIGVAALIALLFYRRRK